jgi:hypothetical protein
MNKYIRKCLLVYVSMAIILCGMVGVTYAITATDADQYVTRSQYAVDMAHLQNKLDEAEAGLMGNINRFRSTDVKFVTFDTPTNYNNSGNYSGYHNGGNWFPRKNISGTTTRNVYPWTNTEGQRSGQYANINMYRIYNGNYIIVPNYAYFNGADYFHPTVNYAIPCENLPGWYLEVRMNTSSYAVQPLLSLVKLDPSVPYTYTYDQIRDMDLIFRFKKEFFQYASNYAEQNQPITTTKQTATNTIGFWNNNSINNAFRYAWRTNQGTSTNLIITVGKWLDPDTGDFMMSLKGYPPFVPTSSNGFTARIDSWSWTVCEVIPKDNVEYCCGNTTGYIFTQGEGFGFPHPRFIGHDTSDTGERYWEYEFVDCPNGIKYWHAYRKPGNTTLPGTTGPREMAAGLHYNIPIVY